MAMHSADEEYFCIQEMFLTMVRYQRFWLAVPLAGVMLLSGCRTAAFWRKQADSKAQSLLTAGQSRELGKTETITVETPADTLRRRLLTSQNLPYHASASLGIWDLDDAGHWRKADHLRVAPADPMPESDSPELVFTLVEALQVAAHNSQDFQNQKDALFSRALALDLETDAFRASFSGMLRESLSTSGEKDGRVTGFNHAGSAGVSKKLANGVQITSAISVNLVEMLTGSRSSFRGISSDSSISVPLLRGAGEWVVTEALTQAERDLLYAVRDFEQLKREFVVRIATSYLNVLQSGQRLRNQEANYKRVIASTRRSRRMADAGRLPEYQFDQAVQDELNARDSWILAQQSYTGAMDSFKVQLGLPTDAQVLLREDELSALSQMYAFLAEGESPADYEGTVIPPADAEITLRPTDNQLTGRNEIDVSKAIGLAMRRRLDLQTLADRVADAQRRVAVAEDALRAEVTLGGSANLGESRGLANTDPGDAALRARPGRFSGFLTIDLPWERTRERNRYREAILALEKSVRAYQAGEDELKKTIRGNLRDLLRNREALIIQSQAVKLAVRRVRSTDLLLQAGRAEVRDLLDAQGALLSAQNALIGAVVNYRLLELQLQANLGVLDVGVDGSWQETDLAAYK